MELSNLVKKVLESKHIPNNEWDLWTHTLDLYPVSQTENMKTFVQLVQQAKENGQKVIVAGDYDCDGIMATSIMVYGLRQFGLECGFYIPDRITEGYGLSETLVKQAHAKEYEVLITVDNGVSAHDALHLAKEFGMIRIVTDHHKIENDVDCECLVHPGTMEAVFSSLCGAGVAYECMRALGVDDDYLLEMACVASIGDVMRVTGETRAIIQQGILRLEKDRRNQIVSLLDTYSSINEENIAFQVVPKLNAVGRLSNLGNVNNVVRYFLSTDFQECASYREQIVHLNNQRKQKSQEMVSLAKSKLHPQEDVLIVADSSFHEGIIGLVAGSLCHEFDKPTIILSKNDNGYKASMRSPEGFDCIEFLRDFDSFEQIGGHSQAVGFFVNLEDYPAFVQYVKERYPSYQWHKQEKETVPVTEQDLTLEDIRSLDVLRPFGPGFENPLFELKDPFVQRIIPIQNGKHGKYLLYGGLSCMNFNQSQRDRNISTTDIQSFIGRAQVNTLRNRVEPTFIIEEIVSKR